MATDDRASEAVPTVSVVVVTYARPECVERCLQHLAAQTLAPMEVIVVDSASDDRTRKIVSGFDGVVYVDSRLGRGHMTAARNLGWRRATGDVVAFVDDDAYADTSWLDYLTRPYSDPEVGGVGGRALTPRTPPPDAAVPIGVITTSGEVVGNFDADPGVAITVDHLIGCNMSFRRGVLEAVGGFYDRYPGTELREDTDVCRRVARAGCMLVFEPRAVVLHVGAPHAVGRRFDVRYEFFSQHNHLVFLRRHYGLRSRELRGYVSEHLLPDVGRGLHHAAGLAARSLARLAGAGTALAMRSGLEPNQTSGTARECIDAGASDRERS